MELKHVRISPFYKGVIADLDGTIINTGNAMMTCLSRWVSAYGFEPPTYNQVMSVVHKLSLNEMLNAFLPDCRNRNFVDSIVAKIENSFADFYLPALASPISSAVESLTEFKKRGFSVAIVTNATRKMLYKSLKIFELKDVVDETVSANDVRRPKPDPSGIQQVLKRLGLEPQQAIFVGDTVTDMLAGRNAKVQSTVGVLIHSITKIECRS